MIRAGGGSIRVSTGFARVARGVAAASTLVVALALGPLVLGASPAAAQNRPEQAIVGAMQRFMSSLPFGGLVAPSPNQKSLPAGPGMVPRPSRDVPTSATGPQLQSLAPPPPGTTAPMPLGPGPAIPVSPSTASISPAVPKDVPLTLAARYGRETAPVNGGIVWRVYPVRPDITGSFRPVREDRTPTPTLALPPGDYVVHAAFGLASAAKTVSLRNEPVREVFDLPAGGLRIEGRVGDVRIPHGQIAFDIFRGSQFEEGEKRQIAAGVATGDVVIVPEGTYHIVSNYGDSNAVVRSDIKVQPGKLTDVTVTHRAAVITLKLVGERGGEALANTSWTVLTPGGDVIKETIGAFPRVVLAEGEYRAIARNDGRTSEREFKVITGVDGEIELLSRR